MHKYLENITMRAGSAVLWRGEQPHCNFPNNSNRLRLNQYFKFLPARWNGSNTDYRLKLIKEKLPQDFTVSALGKKLFGFESYSENSP